MTVRQHLGLRLHGWALRLFPEITTATYIAVRDQVREEVIAALAAQHHLQQAQARQAQHEQQVAARAARQ